VRISFVLMNAPVFCVRVREPEGGERTHECWPTTVTHTLDGASVHMRFAWDRYNHVLYVDDRWPALKSMPRAACEETASRLARQVLREATERASEG
jgi:hypothetical protein